MRKKHTILGGKVALYKRERSSVWQCSTYISGKNRRVSTREEGLGNAKEFAEDWYLTLAGKKRDGSLFDGKSFQQAAQEYLIEFDILTDGTRNRDYVNGHKRRLRLYLNPFFRDKKTAGNHSRCCSGIPRSSAQRLRQAACQKHFASRNCCASAGDEICGA